MEYIYNIWSSIVSLIKTFTVADFFDVIIVSFLIYEFIKLIRETRAVQLVKGILIFSLVYVLSYQLHFRMLSTILSNVFQFGVMVLLLVFQPELRRALEHMGRSRIGNYWNFGDNLWENDNDDKKIIKAVDAVCRAFSSFQVSRTGALIVFERKTKLGDIVSTGTITKAEVSAEIISNIFYNKAPLHDGAMVVKDGLVYAAGCILPLTKNENLSNDLGTRHRAAVGISENSDAIAIVASEETGLISVAINGVLRRINSIDTLKKKLISLLVPEPKNSSYTYKSIITSFKKVARK
ncbi:MAG: diadenylate cyclase CdaA [Oscillospiraceae bacterium]|jgi:diadenylate cyclase|nr:diadenylate cyclase CdaA [Oscillospiraceae bacterium]